MTFKLGEYAVNPSVPAAGYWLIFPKSDGWYSLSSGGVLTKLAPPTLPLAIAEGGTGQITAAAAFKALATILDAKGKIITHNGTDPIAIAVGSNGQVPTADSAEAGGWKWATPAAGSSDDPSTSFNLIEDFVTGNEDTDELGQYGWRSDTGGTGSSLARIDGLVGRPGILRLGCGTTATSRSHIFLGESGLAPIALGGGELYCEVSVRCTLASLATHARTMFGFGDDMTGVGEHSNGVYFRIQSGDTNWQLVSANGGLREVQDTGIAYSSGTWAKFRFTVNAGATSIQAAINGTNAGSPLTTNIPTAAISPSFKTDGIAGGTSMLLDADYMRIRQTFTTPR